MLARGLRRPQRPRRGRGADRGGDVPEDAEGAAGGRRLREPSWRPHARVAARRRRRGALRVRDRVRTNERRHRARARGGREVVGNDRGRRALDRGHAARRERRGLEGDIWNRDANERERRQS